MSDIVIQVNLRLGARWRVALLAGAIMVSLPPELGTESLTLSTYYPAPSGVYTNMLTTGNTFLARDSGNVAVGLNSASYKLHVGGDIRATGNVTSTGDVCTDLAGGRCLSTINSTYPVCNNGNPALATNKPCTLPLYRCPSAFCANGVCSGPWASLGCWGQISVEPQCHVTVSPQTQMYPCSVVSRYVIF